MKKGIINSLGGKTTNPEKELDSGYTRSHTIERLDSEIGVITKCHNKSSYDVRLLSNSKEILGIGVIGNIDTFYMVGSEVILSYTKGRHYSPLIFGSARRSSSKVYGNTGSGSVGSSGTPNLNLQSISTALFQSPLIVSDPLNDRFGANPDGSDAISFILPKAKVHKDLTAAESHEPKIHDHSDVHNGGGNLAMLSLQIPIMADSEAQNNTLYFSTDGRTLVYKDSIGSVYGLY